MRDKRAPGLVDDDDLEDGSLVLDDLPRPVADLLAAANAHVTDAFLATFAPDDAVDDWGREFVGLVAIRGWSDQEFIGVAVRLDVTAVTSRHGETVVTADVGGDGFSGLSHFSFAVDGGRVKRMTIRA